jgi:TetR/AcrR family transcriptional regulator
LATRNPKEKKRRILEAALHEFAEKGIAGARVDAIAESADVNKQMMYHYFGSKEGLFRAVIHNQMRTGGEATAFMDLHLTERLLQLEDQSVILNNYIRLLMWEALEDHSDGGIVDEEHRRKLYRSWVAKTKERQLASEDPSELDAEQLLVSELALAMFPVAFPQLVRLITGKNPTDPKFVIARKRFLEAIGRRLEAPSSPKKTSSPKKKR